MSINIHRVNEAEIISDAGDIIKDTNKMDWIEVGGGSRFKVLKACLTTGNWTLYVSNGPWCPLFRRIDIKEVENFLLPKGELIYDIGSAPAGTYGFEPVYAEHYDAKCEVLTEMFFSGQGSVTYFDKDKNIDWILDSEWLHKLALGEVELDVSPKD